MVYLGVENESELKHWGEKLDMKNIKWVGFIEPDIDNQLTALCCVSDGKEFKKLNLL